MAFMNGLLILIYLLFFGAQWVSGGFRECEQLERCWAALAGPRVHRAFRCRMQLALSLIAAGRGNKESALSNRAIIVPASRIQTLEFKEFRVFPC